jgi:hypothetical protein
VSFCVFLCLFVPFCVFVSVCVCVFFRGGEHSHRLRVQGE